MKSTMDRSSLWADPDILATIDDLPEPRFFITCFA